MDLLDQMLSESEPEQPDNSINFEELFDSLEEPVSAESPSVELDDFDFDREWDKAIEKWGLTA